MFEIAMAQSRDGQIRDGRKLDFARMAKEAVELHRDIVLSEMMTPQNARDFIRVTVEGMKTGQRTQYRAYMEMAKLAGAENKLVVEFIHSLGASGEDQVRRAVQAYQSADGAGTLDAIERLTEALSQLLHIEPTQRDSVVMRLGGIVPVPERVR